MKNKINNYIAISIMLILTISFLIVSYKINFVCGLSLLFGGFCWLIPNELAYKIIMKNKNIKGNNYTNILKKVFFVETIKLFLSFVLILIIIKYFTISPLFFIIGYSLLVLLVLIKNFYILKNIISNKNEH